MPRNRLVTLVTVLTLGTVGAGYARNPQPGQSPEQDMAAVRAVIDAQAAAWNRGDIDGYMEGYANTETTTFVSGDTITHGWQTVRDRYRSRYDTRQKMGTLAFTDLVFTPLGESYVLANGRWRLTRATDTPHGRFTLVFRRTADGWRIIHDHTSSAE